MLITFCVQPPTIFLHSGDKFPSCWACVFDFNVPSMTCDTLRGSSIESLDEIKNLNSTLYSEIYFQTLSGYDNDDPVLECPASLALSSMGHVKFFFNLSFLHCL